MTSRLHAAVAAAAVLLVGCAVTAESAAGDAEAACKAAVEVEAGSAGEAKYTGVDTRAESDEGPVFAYVTTGAVLFDDGGEFAAYGFRCDATVDSRTGDVVAEAELT